MNKFYIVLSDMQGTPDYRHPSEINGRSKQEVFNLIRDEVPQQNIVGIYTEFEYEKLIKSSSVSALSNPGLDEMSGQAFFEQMIQTATKVGMENEQYALDESQNQSRPQAQPQSEPEYVNATEQHSPQPVKTEPIEICGDNTPKYFTDNGIEFKLENGKLYKKCWQTIKPTQIDENSKEIIFDNYRIINHETGKPIRNTRYTIQVLDWEELVH
jgi:hypothetical protein